MKQEKELFSGNRISLYDYKDEKGNDAVILEYGTTKLYIWDEDFEELIHGINFVRSNQMNREVTFTNDLAILENRSC